MTFLPHLKHEGQALLCTLLRTHDSCRVVALGFTYAHNMSPERARELHSESELQIKGLQCSSAVDLSEAPFMTGWLMCAWSPWLTQNRIVDNKRVFSRLYKRLLKWKGLTATLG